MNRNRTKQRWTKAFAALVVGSMLINPNSCVPRDFFYDLAVATQRSLTDNITSLVTNTVTSTVFGNTNDNSNGNDNSGG